MKVVCNKEKFKECLKKAAISRPNCVCSGGWMELIILAKNPEEAYRLALKDKDINLPWDYCILNNY